MSVLTYAEHAEHGQWTKTGRCVYCPCGTRLYQGEAPDDQEQQRQVGEGLDILTGVLFPRDEE